MSIVTARFLAHLVVGGVVLMALGLIGVTFVALFRSAFRVPAKSPKKTKADEGFIFQVAGQETVKPRQKRNLFSLRVFRRTKKQPMAIPLQPSDLSVDWSPVLSPEEEKELFIPTFQRLKRLLQEPSESTESQPVSEKTAPVAETASTEGDEDLFESKDIFKLEPEPAAT